MTKYIIRIPIPLTGHYLYMTGMIHDAVYACDIAESAKRFDSMTEAELFALTHNLGRYKIEPVKSSEIRPIKFPEVRGQWIESGDYKSIEIIKFPWPSPSHDLGGEG